MRYRFFLFFVAASAAFPWIAPGVSRAATFTVTNTTDSNGICSADSCSLREAVNAANSTASDDFIQAGGDLATGQTIVLTAGEFPVEANGSLDVSLPNVKIDAKNLSRVWHVKNGAVFNLKGVSLSYGKAGQQEPGGLLLNEGGQVSMEAGTLTGGYSLTAGGQICSIGGSLKLQSCQLTYGSSGGRGGAIDATDTSIVMERCSVLNGLVQGLGGGISLNGGSLSLQNCTLASNAVNYTGSTGGGGALYASQAVVNLNSCTVVLNEESINSFQLGRGGIYTVGGSLTVANSLVAANSLNYASADYISADLAVDGTQVVNGGFNVIGSNGTVADVFPAGPKTGTPSASLNPRIARRINGYYPLVQGSPALDAGNSSLPAAQNSPVRVYDIPTIANASGSNGSDSGAYEQTDAPQMGTTLVVNALEGDDGVCGLANCTFQEAVDNTNRLESTSNYRITFDEAGIFKTLNTIEIGGAALLILSNVTIDGPTAGVNLKISGDLNTLRVGQYNVSLSRLNLIGNFKPEQGNMLRNEGHLTVKDCSFSGLGARTSSSYRYGGAIYNKNTLSISNSTLSNNRAADGGAIYSEGTLSVSNCTFNGNSATSQGGAICNNNGTLDISNSTLTGNSAGTGGGISNLNGTTTITNCTISGNTDAGGAGGVFSSGTTNFSNSIVAGNNSGAGTGGSTTGSDVGFSGETNTVTSQGYNLIGSGNAASAFNQTGDQTGVSLSQLKLGILNNNGGPTRTLALQDGSIAINTGNTTLTTDQRGTARPQGAVDDIGAVEYTTSDELVVTTLADEDDGTNDSTVGTGRSLREAIITADSRGSGIITFAPNLSGTITLGSQMPEVRKVTEIQGPAAASIAISGNDSYRVLNFFSDDPVKISNLTIRNGYAGSLGIGCGIMTTKSGVTIENCTFVSNHSPFGAALYISTTLSSVSTIRNCTFSDNGASVIGGAIYNDVGTLYVENCTISGNSSSLKNGAGGVASGPPELAVTTLHNSIVAGNTGGDVQYFAPQDNPFYSGGYNLIGTSNAASTFTQPGDQVIGTASPGLAALANNGGPTPTRALLATSPAINLGDPNFNGSDQTDQRGPGFARVKFKRLDIGAFESDFDTPPVPVILTPTNNQSLAIAAFKSITGAATAQLGVTAVQLKLFRTRNGVSTFWNGSAFTTTQTLLNATLSAPGSANTNWTYAVTPALASALDAGLYSVAAYAKDTTGTTSAAVGRNFTLLVDTTAPVPVITTPANNQVLSPAGFTAISGTATDNSGVTGIQIKLFRTRDGVSTFWNGSAFTSTQTLLNATLATPSAPSTTWTYPVSAALRSALDNGVYSTVAYGKDASGNTSAAVGRNFSIDSVIPAAVILTPTQNQTLPLQSFASITGTATDNTVVGQVQIKLFRVRNGVTQFWNGSAFTADQTLLNASLSSPNAASTNWTYTITPVLKAALDSGPYLLTAYAKDTAGNQSPAAGRNFSLSSDTSAPTVAFTTPNQNQPLAASAFTSVAGTATDDIGVTSVQFKLFRSRNGVIEYWNGSAFSTTVTLLNATVSNPGATSTSWNYVVPAALRSALDVGTYNLVAYAKDAAGNQSMGVGRTFSITSVSSALTTVPTSVSGQEF